MTENLPELYEGGEPVALPPESSERSRLVALVLCAIGGIFGMHSFYAGRIQRGVAMALTLGGACFWWAYDFIIVLAGEFKDADGRPIRRWAVGEAGTAGDVSVRELRGLVGQVARLERDVAELAERMDFAERLLAQQKDRQRLP